MDDTSGTPRGSIDDLLKSRAQFQAWLAKLDHADDGTPLHVRARVQADYQGRLETVLVQLRQHAGAVAATLATQQSSLTALEARDAEVAEQLAEAQLRYSVGEYSDEAWEAMSSEARAKRSSLSDEIDASRTEIARLTDVQGIILEGPAAAPVPEPVPEPIAPPMLEIDVPALIQASSAPVPAPEAPPVPRAPALSTHAAPKPTPVPAALDELDFLKSVTDDVAVPSRPHQGHTVATATASHSTSAPASAPPKGKMLKCQECGTENKPTEWYCERCGAELTDL
jgi:hypothetical protein